MSTIGWHDVACTEAPGPVEVRDHTVLITHEHLARWKNDPDGRFKLEASTKGLLQATLGKFYPSL